MATNDVFWDQVVSVEAEGTKEVYDATVLIATTSLPKASRSTTRSNKDADVVILLHRDRSDPERGGG